jgi:hypothetical protein
MRTVARLLYTYFTGSTASKWLTISGLLLILASLYVVLYLPQTERMTALAMPGLLLFFLGSALMPLLFGRLAQSHAARILPGVRIKLLASATLTVMLVALPVGLITPLAYVAGMSANAQLLLENHRLLEYTLWLALFTYTSACIVAAWMYVLIWFITSERNVAGFAKGMAVLILLILLPPSGEPDSNARLQSNVWQFAAFFGIFSIGFLTWPHLKTHYAGLRSSTRKSTASAREFAGREIDLVLGNSRPWILVGVLMLPLAATLRTGPASAEFWLLYLAIAAIVAGGNAERAPARSRALWLRSEGSRAALFAAVERSTWRHNGFVMVALLLLLFALGSFTRMPAAQMATAIPLILIGTTLSTYLGLSLTRGVRLGDALLGVSAMMGMMIIAVMAANGSVRGWIVGGSLAAAATLAIALRSVARHRWAHIDWSLCRGDTERALRTG